MFSSNAIILIGISIAYFVLVCGYNILSFVTLPAQLSIPLLLCSIIIPSKLKILHQIVLILILSLYEDYQAIIVVLCSIILNIHVDLIYIFNPNIIDEFITDVDNTLSNYVDKLHKED